VALGWIFLLVGGTHVHFIATAAWGLRVVGPVFAAVLHIVFMGRMVEPVFGPCGQWKCARRRSSDRRPG
jgi:cbb3-type cytochrome oxidase subunit 1